MKQKLIKIKEILVASMPKENEEELRIYGFSKKSIISSDDSRVNILSSNSGGIVLYNNMFYMKLLIIIFIIFIVYQNIHSEMIGRNIIKLKLSSIAFLKEKIDINNLPLSKRDWAKLNSNTLNLLESLDIDSFSLIYEYGKKSSFIVFFNTSNTNLSIYSFNRKIKINYKLDSLSYKIFEYNKISNYLIMNQIISLEKTPADTNFIFIDPVRYKTNISLSNLIENYNSRIDRLKDKIIEKLLLNKIASDFDINYINNISGYLYFPAPPLIYEEDNKIFVDISLCILYSEVLSSITNNILMHKADELMRRIEEKNLDHK